MLQYSWSFSLMASWRNMSYLASWDIFPVGWSLSVEKLRFFLLVFPSVTAFSILAFAQATSDSFIFFFASISSSCPKVCGRAQYSVSILFCTVFATLFFLFCLIAFYVPYYARNFCLGSINYVLTNLICKMVTISGERWPGLWIRKPNYTHRACSTHILPGGPIISLHACMGGGV